MQSLQAVLPPWLEWEVCAMATAIIACLLVVLLRPRGDNGPSASSVLAEVAAVVPGVKFSPGSEAAARAKSKLGNIHRVDASAAVVVPKVVPCDGAAIENGTGHFGDIGTAGGIVPFTSAVHEKHGDLCVFRFGAQPAVSIGSGALLKELGPLMDRPYEFFASFVPLLTEKSIQVINGQEWRDRRVLVAPSLTHAALRERAYSADAATAVLFDAIEGGSTGKGAAKTWNAKEPALRAAFVGFVSFALGLEPSKAAETVAPLLDAYLSMWPLLMRKALRGETLTEEQEAAMVKGISAFHHAADTLLAERRQHVRHAREKARENDEELESSGLLVDAWATGLDAECARADFITFLIAGFHTTGLVILWSLFHAANNKTLQDSIRAEVAAAIPSDAAKDDSIGVPLSAAEGSKSLDMLINETLRLEGLGGFAVRVATAPTTLAGVVYPTGTRFFSSLSACSLNPSDWKTAEEFCPARFTPPEGKARCPFALPFGQGRRRCPGYDYALVQAKLQLGAVLARYELSLPEGVDAATIERDGSFVPTPVGDMPLIAKRL